MNNPNVNKVDKTFPADTSAQSEMNEAAKLGPPNLKEEQVAYKQMHAKLLENHAGEYVAIYGQKLIDHDSDKIALFQRIEEEYPDTFVLMRPAEQNTGREFYFRSTRLLERI